MDKQTMDVNALRDYWEDSRDCWRQLSDKGFFFALLLVWLALFQFLGNSTFGYIDSPSLFRWMYEAYNHHNEISDDGHGNLIPFVVLALFWWKRKTLLAARLEPWWPGLLLLAFALALHVLGYLVQQPRISIVALFAGIYALMGLAWGREWLRASFFPFFLFAFCIPLGSLTENVTFPLRVLVTKIAAALARTGLGIEVDREGTQLFGADHSFQYDIAPACSGIRSLIAIFALATIYGFVAFPGCWRRLALMVSAFPLAVIGNVIRLMCIIVAAEALGESAGNYVHESTWFSLLPYIPAILGLKILGDRLRGRESTPLPSSKSA